jgi:hypothetical protein
MKKIISVLLLSLVLLSCKKKECKCADVKDKDIDHMLSSSGNVIGTSYTILFYDPCIRESRWVSVSEELYNSLGLGDTYCIP